MGGVCVGWGEGGGRRRTLRGAEARSVRTILPQNGGLCKDSRVNEPDPRTAQTIYSKNTY